MYVSQCLYLHIFRLVWLDFCAKAVVIYVLFAIVQMNTDIKIIQHRPYNSEKRVADTKTHACAHSYIHGRLFESM